MARLHEQLPARLSWTDGSKWYTIFQSQRANGSAVHQELTLNMASALRMSLHAL